MRGVSRGFPTAALFGDLLLGLGGTGLAADSDSASSTTTSSRPVGEGNPQGTRIDIDGSNAVIENNRITNSAVSPTVTSLGISFDCCFAGGLVVNNRIRTMIFGIYDGSSTGKYRDNLLSDVIFPFNGGTNAGNNT